MARPIKDGVDYFPVDVDFFRDDKVRMLRSEFGAKGIYLLMYLLCELYRSNGYYMAWDDDKCYLVSDGAGCGCDVGFVREFVLGCLRRSVFDDGVYKQFQVLTSAGIQRRFVKASESRDTIYMIQDFFLLDLHDKRDISAKALNKISFCRIKSEKTPVISKETPIISEFIPQKEKEKEKETITVYRRSSNEDDGESGERVGEGRRKDFERFWSAYPKKVGKQAAEKAFRRVKEDISVLLSAVEKQKHTDQWCRENGRYIPNPATWLNQGRWEDVIPSSDQSFAPDEFFEAACAKSQKMMTEALKEYRG